MSDDLLTGTEPPITLADQIKCVEREIKMRRRVYPRQVEIGTMRQGMADREIATMEAVQETLLKWGRVTHEIVGQPFQPEVDKAKIIAAREDRK